MNRYFLFQRNNMSGLTTKQKKARKKKSAQKKLIAQQNKANQVENEDQPIDEFQVAAKREKPATDVTPNYKTFVLGFSGSMDQWDALVLKTHNEFGYAFEYEDLIESIIEQIITDKPETEMMFDADKELADIIKVLSVNHPSPYVDMMTVVLKQAAAYWNGDLEKNGLLDYSI